LADASLRRVPEHAHIPDQRPTSGRTPETWKDRPMDRRERSDLLERLVVYRRVYHLRSAYDAEPVLTVAAAITHAMTLFAALTTKPAAQTAG
jgi:hypothetical protein